MNIQGKQFVSVLQTLVQLCFKRCDPQGQSQTFEEMKNLSCGWTQYQIIFQSHSCVQTGEQALTSNLSMPELREVVQNLNPEFLPLWIQHPSPHMHFGGVRHPDLDPEMNFADWAYFLIKLIAPFHPSFISFLTWTLALLLTLKSISHPFSLVAQLTCCCKEICINVSGTVWDVMCYETGPDHCVARLRLMGD